MNKSTIKTALIDTIPVLTGYLFLGIGFGILLNEQGYGFIWSFFMALFMFAGSGQYLAVDLLATGASLLTTAIATLLVNARHLFYGISLLNTYKGMGIKKLYMIFALTDETYSLVSQDKDLPPDERKEYCFWVSLFDQIYWICGCVLGSIAGALLPINFEGVEFVLTALFVTMFVEQWLSTANHVPALIGVCATIISLILFGHEIFLIPSMIMIATLLILSRKSIGGAEHE